MHAQTNHSFDHFFKSVRHPALAKLLRFQTVAKFKKLVSSFRNPRKKALSILAVVLGVMWLSQTIFSVLFRQPATPEQIQTWLPLGLFAYSAWHVIKISTRQVVEPFEWTPAEKEFVIAAPVSRAQQVTYRLTTVATAALAKAICFSIVMIPDISIWIVGLVGMLLGLAFVDLIRICYELFFFGLGRKGRNVCRVIVLSSFGGVFVYAIAKCLLAQTAMSDLSSPAALVFFQNFLEETVSLCRSNVGSIALTPFAFFTNAATASTLGLAWLLNSILGLGLVCLAVVAVFKLDRWMQVKRKQIERANLKLDGRANGLHNSRSKGHLNRAVRVPYRFRGAGSLAWRQMQSVFNYRRTLIVSLAIPILLSCLPLLASHNAGWMLLNLIGSMVFYSFLLLPSALILDYRRDVNRMSVLKSLPIHPFAVTLGQLATPVIICCLFQTIVLAIASCTGKVIIWQAILAGVLLVPVNVLIFAAENYIFLFAPYQRNKEGFDVFLRTILTFTGKGLLFGIAVGLMLAWVTLLVFLANTFSLGPFASTAIFAIGLWGFTLSIAAVFVCGITRQFQRFDPSHDMPGLN